MNFSSWLGKETRILRWKSCSGCRGKPGGLLSWCGGGFDAIISVVYNLFQPSRFVRFSWSIACSLWCLLSLTYCIILIQVVVAAVAAPVAAPVVVVAPVAPAINNHVIVGGGWVEVRPRSGVAGEVGMSNIYDEVAMNEGVVRQSPVIGLQGEINMGAIVPFAVVCGRRFVFYPHFPPAVLRRS